MNITGEVITDLLPIYFSGDANKDTKVLVEDYFRENPEFERIARRAATPLETLRAAPSIAPGSEKERRDLESVLCGLRHRKWLFGLSLFLTLTPVSFYFFHGDLASRIGRDLFWEAAFEWSMAALFWFLYFARLRWRRASLVGAIYLTLIPIPFVLHFAHVPALRGSLAEALCFWVAAAFIWIGYFRPRPR